MNRAYSVLELKAVDDEKRIIEGIATTPAPDRANDVIELDGIDYKLPLPFLLQHNSRQPIGNVVEAKIVKGQMRVRIEMAKAGVAAYIDEAWSLIKAGLIRGLSIGFRSLEEAFDRETGGFHFLRIEWVELSAVTVPMQSEATILAIKSADAALLAHAGATKQPVVSLKASSNVARATSIATQNMTIKEQITAFENKRAANVARVKAIMDKAGDNLSTLEAEAADEYKTLTAEVKSIDDHLERLRESEKLLLPKATPITPETGNNPTAAAAARGAVVQVKSNIPPGIGIARAAIALYNARGNRFAAADLAKQYYPDQPEVELFLKAPVAAMNTSTSGAASQLVTTTNLGSEFLELLRPQTLYGRIPRIRRVPFNISVPVQTGGGTYSWVAQGNAKPVSALAFTSVSLGITKVAGIIVSTKELMRFSNPDAEMIIRNDMIAGIAKYIDEQFVDPAVAAVANQNPGSITNGITPITASGTTAAHLRADLANLLDNFVASGQPLSRLVLLTSESIATRIGLLRTALDQPEFPDIRATGGSLIGIPVVASENVGARIIALIPEEILVADDGPIDIDISEEASIVMDSAPQASPQTTSLVSLWQRNYVGIRGEKFINWVRGRNSAVEFIQTAVYSG